MTKPLVHVEISAQLPELLFAQLRPDKMKRVAEAVDRVANRVLREWVRFAHGKVEVGGRRLTRTTGAYAHSIQVRPLDDNPRSIGRRVFSDSPYAQIIELGAPRRDQKEALKTSLMVRVSSKGKRYLIIPFRHGTPGTSTMRPMPEDVHEIVKNHKGSGVLVHAARPSGQIPEIQQAAIRRGLPSGMYHTMGRSLVMVPGRWYKWGDRAPEFAHHKLKKEHKTDPYAGMVRMEHDQPGSRHSEYVTFRTMSEDSPADSWIIKAKEGFHVIPYLKAKFGGIEFEQEVAEAFREDFEEAKATHG